MKRKLTLLFAAIIIAFSFIPSANAIDLISFNSSESGDSLDYTYIVSATTNLSISGGGYAAISNNISCVPYVDKIVMSTYLQQYDSGWVTVNHWSDTVYANGASANHSDYVENGYTYRSLVYFYAYVGSTYESATRTDSEYY